MRLSDRCRNRPEFASESKSAGKVSIWPGSRLGSTRLKPIGLVVLTKPTTVPLAIPQMEMLAVSGEGGDFLVPPRRLAHFIRVHAQENFVCHDAATTYWCLEKHLREASLGGDRILKRICHEGRLLDTMLLESLLELAAGPEITQPKADRDDDLEPRNLKILAQRYGLASKLKGSARQLEGVGRSASRLGKPRSPEKPESDEAGNQELRAAAVIRELYDRQAKKAYRLMVANGFDRKASRYTIHPQAISRYGFLSEVIQVNASIVLADLSRKGIQADLIGAEQLIQKLEKEVKHESRKVQRLGAQLLGRGLAADRGRGGSVCKTLFRPRELEVVLGRLAADLQDNDPDFEVPQKKKGRGGIPLGANAWRQYAAKSSFIAAWVNLNDAEAKLRFLRRLTAPTLHCQYRVLSRTGRAVCSGPKDASIPGLNLHQTPKDNELRGLIVPRQGADRLLAADYSSIELRTLAAICLAQTGKSRLAEFFGSNIDPHAFTAAKILNLGLKDFEQLRLSEPEKHRKFRQAAKAINIGVPGGMSVRLLLESVRDSFGIDLTEAEATGFRDALVNEIFPELSPRDGYLAWPRVQLLARNLGVGEALLKQGLLSLCGGDTTRTRESIEMRCAEVERVVEGTSREGWSERNKIWSVLKRLAARSTRELAPEIVSGIEERKGSPKLHRMLFGQTISSLTGRLRANVDFTESKNTPMQALAADGAKLALWNLYYQGFDVYGFVHDEILVNLPSDAPPGTAEAVVKIMEDSMEQVLEGVPAECQWKVSDRWFS